MRGNGIAIAGERKDDEENLNLRSVAGKVEELEFAKIRSGSNVIYLPS